MEKKEILKIDNLHISFDSPEASSTVIRGVSLSLREGEILALVGESGCGKSVTAHSILKLLPSPPARITEGSISLSGHEVLSLDEADMQPLRGTLAGMVFQDHMTGLNPTMRIGRQLTEVLRHRNHLTRKACEAEAIRLLQSVQIADAKRRSRQYPHELSGGMRQRVMIAMALNPRLLIADEPTTALDVTIQAQILKLLLTIREETGTAILFITHDLGVVANLADTVAVMYAGKIVEKGTTKDLFHNCAHPYTEALLRSIPSGLLAKKKELQVIPGSLPDFQNLTSGCAFFARCDYGMPICKEKEPPQYQIDSTHHAACWKLQREV